MIHTKRLTLRPFCDADLDALHSIFSDPRAMQYWDRPAWNDPEKTKGVLADFMRHAPQDHLELGIALDGQLIGRAGLWQRYEIAYILHPDYWGHGYASEAVAALIGTVWTQFPDAPALTAEIDPRNLSSAKLLGRLGFELTGVEKENFDYGGIEMTDTAYYRLKRSSDA